MSKSWGSQGRCSYGRGQTEEYGDEKTNYSDHRSFLCFILISYMPKKCHRNASSNSDRCFVLSRDGSKIALVSDGANKFTMIDLG